MSKSKRPPRIASRRKAPAVLAPTAADLTLAVSESALKQALAAFIELFRFDFSKSTSGSLRFGIHVKCHIQKGSLSLEPPDPLNPIYQGGFFKLMDLVIAWDNLDFTVTVHLPKVGWDGFCLIPNPFGGCAVEIPGASFFDTDISVTVPIDDIVRSRIDLGLAPLAHHVWNSDRGTYEWRVVPQIVWSNIQPLDIADTVGDLINGIIKKLIDEALSFLPDWAKDIVDAIVGGIANFVRALLSLPADLQSWLSNLLRVSLDPFDLIIQILVNYFQNDLPLYVLDDPMEIMQKETTPVLLPAVKMPVTAMILHVEKQEFVVEVTS